MNDHKLKEILLELEYKLLGPQVRGTKEELEYLLAPGMCEIGRSGEFYDRDLIVTSLLEDPSMEGPMTIEDFELRHVSGDIALVTYRIIENKSLRSSLWKKYDEDWKMVFHQGTPSA